MLPCSGSSPGDSPGGHRGSRYRDCIFPLDADSSARDQPSLRGGFRRSHWCVSQGTSLLGQGGHEFAAEVGDVGDHAAPDQVGGGRETVVNVSDGRLGRGIIRSPSSIGVPTGVRLAWRTEGSGSARKDPPTHRTLWRRMTTSRRFSPTSTPLTRSRRCL
jgi:hypothetical protein